MPRARTTESQSPYAQYEGTELWKSLEKGIADLVRNKDVKEQTPRPYIVGYLCKVIASRQKNLLNLIAPKRRRP
jgi:hypothetical protein